MELRTRSGQVMFVNDEYIYMQALERRIMELNSKGNLTPEEVENINEAMFQYNQISDYIKEEQEENVRTM